MRGAKAAFAGVSAIALGATLAWTLLPALGGALPSADPSATLGRALWFERSLDVILQGFILLTGVFAVLLLLRNEPGGARLD